MARAFTRKLPAIATTMAVLCIAAQAVAEDYNWQLPEWVPRPLVPADNPMSEAKVELGRHLFYDTRLSADNTVSCATCHQQQLAFTDGKAIASGIGGIKGVRNSMSLTNVAYLPVLTWANPLLKTLETQALVPLFGSHPVEMGMEGKEQLLFDRLQSDAQYPDLFRQSFPEQNGVINLNTITKAIAAFQRSLVSFEAPYYQYKYGGVSDALSESAKRGEELFFSERLECYHCHGGLNLTDNLIHSRMPFGEVGFHNTGLYNLDGQGSYPMGNQGVKEITDNPADEGKFRTPTLLNIEVTAPYMHDGSINTLEEVILDHYSLRGRSASNGQPPSPRRSMLLVGFQLDDDELNDLVAFLKSLTDAKFLNEPRHSDPFERDN